MHFNAYQWQSSPNNSTWTNISGATSQNYTPPNLTTTTYYRRQVASNDATVSSNVSTITVFAQLQGGSVTPTALSINYNTAPGQLTGTTPAGGNGTYTYQWQSSPNNSTWTNLSGATSQNYTPPNLTATTYYRRQVKSNGATVNSNVSTITVYAQLQGASVTPTTLSINYNTSPGLLTGTAATGGNGTYAYQWQSSPNNSTWTNISGATHQNYTPTNLTATTYYRRQVTSNTVTVSSNVSTITVYTPLQAGALTPGSISIVTGSSPGNLGGATASGGSGSYTYQWEKSSDNITWATISGATAQDYNPGNLSAVQWFRRKVSSNGVTVTSTAITISILPPAVTTPVAYGNTIMNFVRTWTATAPEKYPALLISRPLKDV